jgi:DNA-binding transcriptional LysR family regulator
MKLDQLDGLVAFTAVARTKSFTAAAAALEVTPPAISQAVRALEERLQVRLFNRTTRSVGLTEAGELFLARVGPATGELLEATELLQAYRERPSGLLRINLPRIAYAALLQPLLEAFLRAYPEIRVELYFDDGFANIIEGGFDAGIRLGDAVARDMISLALSPPQRTAIIAAPRYLKRKGVPRKIEDLKAHECIRFRFPTSGAIFRWEMLRNRRMVEVEVQGPLIVNDTEALVQTAVDGIGLSYVMEKSAAPWLASGRLKTVLEDFCPTVAAFHLYYPSRRQMPAKLRCLIDFLKANRPG